MKDPALVDAHRARLACRMARLPIALVALACLAMASPAEAAAKKSSKARAAKVVTFEPAVPFIEDDFGRALALAKERKLPVFIEGWAPW